MGIDKDLLDQLMEGRSPGDLFGKDGILQELIKALAERALSTELDMHLTEKRAAPPPEGANQPANRRNGSSQKTVTPESGKVVLDIPRDRNGSFDPLLIAKHQRRFPEFDTKIVSMYAIRVNIGSDGSVSNKAVFVALAILPDGTRDILGLWFQVNEGAKFSAKVLNDLRNRGVQDILITVVDGLTGFPQAIEAAFR